MRRETVPRARMAGVRNSPAGTWPVLKNLAPIVLGFALLFLAAGALMH